MNWLAKEGNEVFEFEAKDLDEASMACEMWNAQLIGYSKFFPFDKELGYSETKRYNLKGESLVVNELDNNLK